ncbi:aminopeptidase [Knoellia sp. S7-12]|uniref:aminopeptidase n=1 Tax=Knoellia sp. S7-12 TaxID=3126698 RepID=UPI00336939C5
MIPTWSDLASAICEGLTVERGTHVAVTLTDTSAMPLCDALVEEVHRRGALPQVVLVTDSFERSAFIHADDETLRTPGPLEAAALEWADVYVALRAMVPPEATPPATGRTASDDARRRVLQRLAKGDISSLRWQQSRWAIVRVPTSEWALWAGVPEAQFIAENIKGCLMDWPAQRRRWEGLAQAFTEARTVQIISEDTDLTLSVAGRTWAVFAGESNFPDGELASAPVEDGVHGYITFPGTFAFADTTFTDLRLTFEAGACVDVYARAGEEVARGLVTADQGACRIGELGVGVNHLIQTMVGDLFVDEKILGTVHIALGRAYPQCGGVNKSSLHWDLVKDLRPDGAGRGGGNLLIDGVPVLHQGAPVGALVDHLDPLALLPKLSSPHYART